MATGYRYHRCSKAGYQLEGDSADWHAKRDEAGCGDPAGTTARRSHGGMGSSRLRRCVGCVPRPRQERAGDGSILGNNEQAMGMGLPGSLSGPGRQAGPSITWSGVGWVGAMRTGRQAGSKDGASLRLKFQVCHLQIDRLSVKIPGRSMGRRGECSVWGGSMCATDPVPCERQGRRSGLGGAAGRAGFGRARERQGARGEHGVEGRNRRGLAGCHSPSPSASIPAD